MCYFNPPCKFQRLDGECSIASHQVKPEDADCRIEDDIDIDTLTLDIIDYIEERDGYD